MNQTVKVPPSVAASCTFGGLDAVVAIPVHNEQERIGACLQALAAQIGLDPFSLGIVLFLNNCTDGTADAVATLASEMPWPMRIIAVHDEEASAGWARRKAMETAGRWLAECGAEDGTILTTDADSRVAPDWVARNLAHLAAGAAGVAGRISLDPADAALLPPGLHARGRLEGSYEALLTEIGARLDPEPENPWPCHWTRSGATLAVRRSAYDRVGGMPALPHGEDRAFVEALRAADLVVRHAPDLEVVTSGRLDGRAAGGAAETMKRRCAIPDDPCDDRLERLDRALKRVLWRRALRRLHAKRYLRRTWLWAPALGISRSEAARIAALPSFGQAHAAIEAASPTLAYRPLRPSQLLRQIRQATMLVRVLRLFGRATPAPTERGADRGGTPASGSDAALARRAPTPR